MCQALAESKSTSEERFKVAQHEAEVAGKIAECEDPKGKLVLARIETIRNTMAATRARFQADYEEKIRGRLDFDAEKADAEMAKMEAEAMRLKA